MQEAENSAMRTGVNEIDSDSPWIGPRISQSQFCSHEEPDTELWRLRPISKKTGIIVRRQQVIG